MAVAPRVYLSERMHTLLYVGAPINIPVLTLENYTKWYELHLVNPDGSVTTVDSSVIDAVQDQHRDARWVDHLYHPRLLYRVAEYLNAAVDERAVEVAAGRWILESTQFENELERFKFHDPSLDDVD